MSRFTLSFAILLCKCCSEENFLRNSRCFGMLATTCCKLLYSSSSLYCAIVCIVPHYSDDVNRSVVVELVIILVNVCFVCDDNKLVVLTGAMCIAVH